MRKMPIKTIEEIIQKKFTIYVHQNVLNSIFQANITNA